MNKIKMYYNLLNILELLEKKKYDYNSVYRIPTVWNTEGFNKITKVNCRHNEIAVNPYEFQIHNIKNGILKHASLDKDYLTSIVKTKKSEDKCSTMYSMLIRMFACWDHCKNDTYIAGTFLKTIALLPYIKSLGVDTIYLLPIFENSEKYKKGEIGSPYSVKNLYKIDYLLHDELLGEYSEDILNIEFKAFMEACHILGISVIIDFVFRTVSRDNDLLVTHPEWFYWINAESSSNFSLPYLNELLPFTEVNDESVDIMYKSSEIEEYLKNFKDSPNVINQERFSEILMQSGENILDLIEKEYDITTVPGFSDVINDNQPLWSDVTYLKYFFDYNDKIKPYVKDGQKPYILQDGVSLNVYAGQEPNLELWELVCATIPFYERGFGIDGARVDSAHVLPAELNKSIIYRARKDNPNFIFWSEEFESENTINSKNQGYDLITGNLWAEFINLNKSNFYVDILMHALNSAIPVISALEIPDSPRSWLIHNEKFKMMLVLSLFIPNTIMLINNGMETGEIQPMNLGLENTEEGKYVLEKDNPQYGKLAFFDNYRLDWLNKDIYLNLNILKSINRLKTKFNSIIDDKKNFILHNRSSFEEGLIILPYFNLLESRGVSFILNINASQIRVNLEEFGFSKYKKQLSYFVEYCESEDEIFIIDDKHVDLEPNTWVVIGAF